MNEPQEPYRKYQHVEKFASTEVDGILQRFANVKIRQTLPELF